jgi:thiamine-phosphate pyrophosphorylase
MLQVRAKGTPSACFFSFARDILAAVAGRSRVIVNDRFDIALALGADGVHLGEHDLTAGAVRPLVPPGFLIGATCRDPEAARRAEAEGADYLGAGAVFPTASKDDTRVIGLAGLAGVARAVRIPVYGIAGITLENCAAVVRAGAYGCAGITVVSSSPDPAAAYAALEEALRLAAGQ